MVMTHAPVARLELVLVVLPQRRWCRLSLLFLWTPLLEPPSSSPTLFAPALASPLAQAVALPRLPASPLTGLTPALRAAVARQGVTRNEPPIASLQETQPPTAAPSRLLTATRNR